MVRCDDLLPRLQRAWRGVAARGDVTALHDALVAAWSGPGRHYHGLGHLHDGLSRLDGLRPALRHPNEVELAWWFHDAIQDPGASDNEARSAAWAEAALSEARADTTATARIVRMILATKHREPPATPDEAAVVDLDLAVLGADVAAYDAYAAGVRAEYAALPDEGWAVGRGVFLEGLLGRPRLFHTEAFHLALHERARANLGRELRALRRD